MANQTATFGVTVMEHLDQALDLFRQLFVIYPALKNWIPVYAFGSVVAIFRSIFTEQRRSACLLFIESFFGGVCAIIAWDATKGSNWQLLWTGAAAVASGGLVMGINRAGKQFAEKPFDVFERIWGVVSPVIWPKKISESSEALPDAGIEQLPPVDDEPV